MLGDFTIKNAKLGKGNLYLTKEDSVKWWLNDKLSTILSDNDLAAATDIATAPISCLVRMVQLFGHIHQHCHDCFMYWAWHVCAWKDGGIGD